MGVFTGTHTNKVDKKGRVSVPKTFRALFESESFQGVYVFPSFRQSALEACAESFMERIVVPEEFLGDVGIKDEITFVGRGRTFQMWAPKAYTDARKPAFERARTRGLTLKLRRPSDAGGEG